MILILYSLSVNVIKALKGRLQRTSGKWGGGGGFEISDAFPDKGGGGGGGGGWGVRFVKIWTSENC